MRTILTPGRARIARALERTRSGLTRNLPKNRERKVTRRDAPLPIPAMGSFVIQGNSAVRRSVDLVAPLHQSARADRYKDRCIEQELDRVRILTRDVRAYTARRLILTGQTVRVLQPLETRRCGRGLVADVRMLVTVQGQAQSLTERLLVRAELVTQLRSASISIDREDFEIFGIKVDDPATIEIDQRPCMELAGPEVDL